MPVTTWIPVRERFSPSTHSAYSVTEQCRRRGDVFRMARRKIFTGWSCGTNSSSSEASFSRACSYTEYP